MEKEIKRSNIGKVEKAFDFGRKRTRVSGKSFNDIQVFKADAMQIPVDTETRKDITCFWDDFIVRESPVKLIAGKRFVKQSAITCYDGQLLSSDNQEHKIDQMSTFVNLVYYIGKCALENENLEYIVIDNKLSICIPVREFFDGEDNALKSILHGYYELYYPVVDSTVLFDIDKENVYVSAEGLVALMPFIAKATWRTKLAKANILILDGGHGSFDIAIMKSLEPQRRATITSPDAGIGLESAVSGLLSQARFSNSMDNVNSAMGRGVVVKAGKDVPVGKYVVRAKESYVSVIHPVIISALSMAKMSLQDIDYVFAVGRTFSVFGEVGTEEYTGDLTQMLVDSWGLNTEILRIDSNDVEIVTELGILRESDNPTEIVSKNEIANLRGVSLILKAKCV